MVQQPTQCFVQEPLAKQDIHNSQHVHQLSLPLKYNIESIDQNIISVYMTIEIIIRKFTYLPGTLTKNFGSTWKWFRNVSHNKFIRLVFRSVFNSFEIPTEMSLEVSLMIVFFSSVERCDVSIYLSIVYNVSLFFQYPNSVLNLLILYFFLFSSALVSYIESIVYKIINEQLTFYFWSYKIIKWNDKKN